MDTLALPSTSDQANSAHAILGRALTLASSFESECRLVAFALKLKEPYLASDDAQAFQRFLEKIACAKLVENQTLIISGLKLSVKYKDWLSDARDARNYIAHEAGEDFEMKLQKKEQWDMWRQTLRERLQQLAVGKQITAILLARAANGVMPSASTLAAYPERIIAWALSECHG